MPQGARQTAADAAAASAPSYRLVVSASARDANMTGDALTFGLWRAAAMLRHPGLHRKFLRRMRRFPDVARPQEYTDRMLWRKLFDRNPLFITFANKLATKDWIKARCPELPLPVTLWRGTDPTAIPRALIRPGVIVKANHGSSFNLRIGDVVPPYEEVVHTAQRWLAKSWGHRRGEWHYALVRREVFVEEAVGGNGPLVDIQIRAGSGRVGLCSFTYDTKTPRQTVRYLDTDGKMVTNNMHAVLAASGTRPAPSGFAAAITAARQLSQEVDFARFDFLSDETGLWGGEITVFPASGYGALEGDLRALVLGSWDLRNSWFLRQGTVHAGSFVQRYASALRRACDSGELTA